MSEIEGVQQEVDQNNTVPAFDKSKEAPVDQKLVDKIGALRCIVDIDNLLQNSLFPGAVAGQVLNAQKFLKELYTPIRQECEAHPDWLRASDPKAYEEKKILQRAEEKREKKEAKKKGLLSRFSRAN